MYTHTFVLERTIKVYTCVCLCCIKKRGRNSGKCAQHFLCRTGGDGGSGNWGAGKGICRETLVYTFYIFWFLNNNLLPIQKLNLKISTILLRCRLTNCSRPTLWLTLSFFFYCPPIEIIVDFSAPEVCSLDFCLSLASHLLLLHKISKCQTMNIKKKSHMHQYLSYLPTPFLRHAQIWKWKKKSLLF